MRHILLVLIAASVLVGCVSYQDMLAQRAGYANAAEQEAAERREMEQQRAAQARAAAQKAFDACVLYGHGPQSTTHAACMRTAYAQIMEAERQRRLDAAAMALGMYNANPWRGSTSAFIDMLPSPIPEPEEPAKRAPQRCQTYTATNDAGTSLWCR